MLCTPWQLAQLATVCEPALAARPWKEESKLTSRSLGRPNLRVRRTSPWQLPQVSRMWLAFTGEAALVCLRILCSPWQSVHSGAWVTPRASAWPCTLARYCSTTSVWHMPQVSGTAMRKAWDFGRQQFVRAAVAQGAIGRAFVAALARLAVDAAWRNRRPGPGWQVVQAGFGDAGGMGILLVGLVAGVAGQPRVRALGQLLRPARGSEVQDRRRRCCRFAPAAQRNRPRRAEPSRKPDEEMPGSS